MARWIVTVGITNYGPFDDINEADLFAAFVSVEIDPAKVSMLRSPVLELLSWRDMVKGDPTLVRGES